MLPMRSSFTTFRSAGALVFWFTFVSMNIRLLRSWRVWLRPKPRRVSVAKTSCSATCRHHGSGRLVSLAGETDLRLEFRLGFDRVGDQTSLFCFLQNATRAFSIASVADEESGTQYDLGHDKTLTLQLF